MLIAERQKYKNIYRNGNYHNITHIKEYISYLIISNNG